MLQLTQNQNEGPRITEVPFPALTENKVLVRVAHSLISAGTESQRVESAKKSLLGKAMEKPEQLKRVMDLAKSQGVIPTIRAVRQKLSSMGSLGYSCAGTVINAGANVFSVKIGDRVACGGAGAGHAEVVAVEENLCVKVPGNIQLAHAACTTIGAIALQGIRQADLRLGENCVVIGLGLIGQLTIQMLKASGVRVTGIDIDRRMVDLAIKSGADISLERSDPTLESQVLNATGGFGTDAVIITAGTSSLDPVELAGQLCRKKGKVVIVGAVPTGFSRSNYFKKELSLLMSCSYGPGRYELNYEEKGMDYPIGYVRWTEKRNMIAFLDLLSDRRITLEPLITHTYPFEKAPDAYDLILNKTEPYVGILLEYNPDKEITKIVETDLNRAPGPQDPNIGFIGAGAFAQRFLLPLAKKHGNLFGVATSSGHSAKNAARNFGFTLSTNDYLDLLKDERINTIFIATRHHLHFQQVMDSLRHGKDVFVEKPLCLKPGELEMIKSESEQKNLRLMVGFNRRFSPFIRKAMEMLGKDSPVAINYRINAGTIPPDSWIQDHEIGGGRIIGEVCHFLDLAAFLARSPIRDISCQNMKDARDLWDTLNVNLSFENGSIANISYFSNGSRLQEKERLEIFSDNLSIVINDFKEMTLFAKRTERLKLPMPDKGHEREVMLFLNSVREGKLAPIPFAEIYNSTLATFKVIESLRQRKMVTLP
jgi:predicted dehydrogenase/threonine dehydrogenase-like Zn-dependent dehydrogenase